MAFFRWFDAHPATYWWVLAIPSAILAWELVAGLRRDPDAAAGKVAGFDWKFAVLVLAVLLAWRWPPLFVHQHLNPDESVFIAGALTAREHGIPWLGFDAATSGPLNVYALMPTHFLGIPQDYFNARVTGLLLVWGALLATYGLLRSVYGTARARFSVVPGIVFFAAATDTDFIHYSSEHVALFLASLGACLLWKHRPTPDRGGKVGLRWLAGGLAVGLLPWAKLQAVPIAAAMVAWAAWLVLADAASPWTVRGRRAGALAAAALAPSAIFMLALLATGAFRDFYYSYILDSLIYVGAGQARATVLGELIRGAYYTWHFPAFLCAPVLTVAAAAVACVGRRRWPSPLFAAGAWFAAATVYAVLAPGRDFAHYLLFLILPLTLWSGAALGDVWESVRGPWMRRALALGFAGLGALLPVGIRATQPLPMIFGQFAEVWRHPRDEVGQALHTLRRPGDSLLVWGWFAHAYVESGLPQATREAQTDRAIRPSPLRDTYFRPRLMSDLRRSRPAFIVDAVGSGAFIYTNRAESAHEIFPELRDYVQANYVLLSDVGYARIYVRTDRRPPKP